MNEFSEALTAIPDMVDQNQTTSSHNNNNCLIVDELNRFTSILCLICKMIQTQHRSLFEVLGGFVYDGKRICK